MKWYLTIDIIHPKDGLTRPVNKAVFEDLYDLSSAISEWEGKQYPVQISIEPIDIAE